MECATLAQFLREEQAPNGAFRCRLQYRHQEVEDLNGFATALVLRHLRVLPAESAWDEIRQRGLVFLERCASPHLPGAFGFWPAPHRPAWARKVPEDVDDTAIINLELARHGRRTLAEVSRVVFEVLVPALLTEVDPCGPPWLRPLVFPTWLGLKADRANIVDCALNANVMALMAWAGLTYLPGYQEAAAMIEAGLTWAGSQPVRLASLTPYYPNPREFLFVLEHAVDCGVRELQPARDRLQEVLSRLTASPPAGKPLWPEALCGNAYSGPFWVCPALDMVRDWVVQA